MRIAIAGGTGVAGRAVAARIRELGHDPVVLSRRNGCDLLDRSSVLRALSDVEAVIDVSNPPTIRRKKATAFFEAATKNLAAARSAHHIARSVILSILAVDQVPGYGYFEAKVAHESAAKKCEPPSQIVRAAQFYEFPGQLLERATVGPWCFLPKMTIQPIAVATVAEVLVDTVLAPATGETRDIAGPEVHQLVALATEEAQVRGRPRNVVGFMVPGKVGRLLTSNTLTAQAQAQAHTEILGPGLVAWRASNLAT